jgi:hypothetical protein
MRAIRHSMATGLFGSTLLHVLMHGIRDTRCLRGRTFLATHAQIHNHIRRNIASLRSVRHRLDRIEGSCLPSVIAFRFCIRLPYQGADPKVSFRIYGKPQSLPSLD